MSTEPKTPLEQVNDSLNQLREIRHYAKNYVEQLTAQWLLFDGELKKFGHADAIEALMMRQSELHDALEQRISALEELAMQLQPAPEEAQDGT